MRTEELEKIAALAVENLKDELTASFEEAVNEAHRLGLNDGLSNRLQEGTFEWASFAKTKER